MLIYTHQNRQLQQMLRLIAFAIAGIVDKGSATLLASGNPQNLGNNVEGSGELVDSVHQIIKGRGIVPIDYVQRDR